MGFRKQCQVFPTAFPPSAPVTFVLWMDCHAKRLECVQLAGAVVRRWWSVSGSKLRALQTLRAVRLRFCILAPLRWFNCGFQDDAPGDGIPGPNLPGGADRKSTRLNS